MLITYFPKIKKTILSPLCFIKRFKKDKSGVTAVEFSLIALPFFMLIFAILETGLIFFGSLSLENSINQTSRLVRTGQAQNTSMTEAQFKTNVCATLNSFFDCSSKLHVELRSFQTFQELADYLDNPANEPFDSSGDLRTDFTFEDSTNPGDIILLRGYLEWDIVLSFPGSGLGNMNNGNRLLAATTSFKNEPF